jgi:hypothetical protein
VHRQLVLKLLIQNEFIEGDFEPAMSFFGSAVEILEPVSMNSQAPTLLPPFMQRICSAPEYKIRGGAVFHWLLRAWRERDPVSKFMYLFIPLESVLQSDGTFGRMFHLRMRHARWRISSSDTSRSSCLARPMSTRRGGARSGVSMADRPPKSCTFL